MKNNTPKHPLAEIVWLAFSENDYQDSASLGRFLAGNVLISGEAGRSYSIVAKDVLRYMEAQGLLRRDEDGWFRPSRPVRRTTDYGRLEAILNLSL
jgi:hypothetical protein